MNRLLGLGLLAGFLLCQLVSVADAQERLRIIQETLHKNSPVVVVSRRIGEKAFDRAYENRHGIMAGPRWIKELIFDVKNVTNKNITYISLDLVIPQSGKMVRTGRIVSIFFGNRTAPAGTPKDPNSKQDLLLPGEVVNLGIGDTERTNLDNYLRENDAYDVERITMDIREVHFDDGTGWQMGIELRQDPLVPKNWIPVIPGQATNQRFSSVWMAAFVRPPLFDFFGGYMALLIPAPCRNFFVVAPPTPPTCAYFRGSSSPIPCTGNCTGPWDPIGCDQLPDDTLYPTAPGNLGYMLSDQDASCYPVPKEGNQATCATCTGATRDKWQDDALCGQPHTCGNRADWGCVEGLVEVDGICQRSVEYQQQCPNPPGYDSLTCSCGSGGCQRECPTGYVLDPIECLCVFDGGGTPIVLDISGDGYPLTNTSDGVNFDLDPDGFRERLAWTAIASDDAWLVLNRNGNGMIDDGTEMFGNFTPQPEPPVGEQRNGFLALAEFDKPQRNGNDDGKIDAQDGVFSRLRLWQDGNHNGVSEHTELFRLGALGVAAIDLDYRETRRRDQHGNWFRYRVRAYAAQGSNLNPWAWDVILKTRN